MVCHAIAYMVETGGHETRILEPDVQWGAELAEAALVLVIGDKDEDMAWCDEDIPVLRLVDTPPQKESLGEKAILWPCTAGELQHVISRAFDAHERPRHPGARAG